MKINNNNKGKVSAAVGIILAWVCILGFAFYKEMGTKMIALFIVNFICCGIYPVYYMLKINPKKGLCTLYGKSKK